MHLSHRHNDHLGAWVQVVRDRSGEVGNGVGKSGCGGNRGKIAPGAVISRSSPTEIAEIAKNRTDLTPISWVLQGDPSSPKFVPIEFSNAAKSSDIGLHFAKMAASLPKIKNLASEL